MTVILDSTAILHLNQHRNKMLSVLQDFEVTQTYITRINYLEILSGASEPRKVDIRKVLNEFNMLEFTEACKKTANKLAMQHRVSTKNQKDFLIASIAITNNYPIVTANKDHFNFKGLKTKFYDTLSWF